MLSMAVTDLDFFVGIPDAFGFNFDNTSIGGLFALSATGEKFATIQAQTENFAFVSPLPFTLEADKLGIGINAGHDLDLHNLAFLKKEIPSLLEVSIGHALIADALYLGLENTIQLYLKKLG
jgi:pyridoxine 5-phosphate synthase